MWRHMDDARDQRRRRFHNLVVAQSFSVVAPGRPSQSLSCFSAARSGPIVPSRPHAHSCVNTPGITVGNGMRE